MLHVSDGIFKQDTPSNMWSISVPEGRTNVELTGVYSLDGRSSIPFDSFTFVEGELTIYFGVDEYSGIARYEYDLSDEGAIVINGKGGVINLTVNQSNDGDPTPVVPFSFSNVQSVSVPKMSGLRAVLVTREGKLVPMLINPEQTDLDTLTFKFFKPETGLVI